MSLNLLCCLMSVNSAPSVQGLACIITRIGFLFSQDLDSGKYLSPRAYRISPVMRLLSVNQTACMANLSNDLTVNNSNSACLKVLTRPLFLHYDFKMFFFFDAWITPEHRKKALKGKTLSLCAMALLKCIL